MKRKFNQYLSSINRFVRTPGFNIFVGIVTVIISIYDINDDFSQIKKEHLTLIIGILMVIDSLNDLFEGTQKVFIIDKNPKIVKVLALFKKTMKSSLYCISIGFVIIITNWFDIYEDFLIIRKEHYGLIIGIICLIKALKNIYDGGKMEYAKLK